MINHKSYRWKQIILPIGLIVLVSALVFLPFINNLGFYRDDWYMLWSAMTRGADSIIKLFSIDRPFMGYTYDLTYRLLGSSPLPWQIYAFTLKTLGALSVYGIMRLIWPEQRQAATAAALIYLIYPGFLQQPNAATLTNQLLSLTSVLASIWISGLSVKPRSMGSRITLVSIAVLLSLLNLLLYEYMIGLEVLRLCVLWLVPQQNEQLIIRGRIRRLIRDWLPYLIVVMGFLVWRIVFFNSGRVGTDQFSILQTMAINIRSTIARMGVQSILDPLETLVLAWAAPFEQYMAQEKLKMLATALITSAVIMAIALIGIWMEKRIQEKDEIEKHGHGRAFSVCIAGGISLIAALSPVIAVGRDVHFSGGFDRYTLHASPAVAILLAGILYGFIQGRGRQVLLGLLLFLGITTQVLNAYHWERFWENEKNLWWQLWWRAPGLDNGTTLLASIPEEGFFEDYELWGPANLIYRPNIESVSIGAEILNPETIWKVWSGEKEVRSMRGLDYERDFNKSLLLALPSDSSCLKIVDSKDILLPLRYEPRLVPILRFSNVDQIDPSASSLIPPLTIFGPEPVHNWCFYYQSAEKAKQVSDWEAVAQLGDEAITAGLRPVDRAEWLPFLEGYLQIWDESKVEYITGEISADAPLVKQICDVLENRQFRFGEDLQQKLIKTLCSY